MTSQLVRIMFAFSLGCTFAGTIMDCMKVSQGSMVQAGINLDFTVNDNTLGNITVTVVQQEEASGPPFKIWLQMHNPKLHNEIYYSVIHTICELPDRLKNTPWDVLYKDSNTKTEKNNVEFYLGEYVPGQLLPIYEQFNETIRDTCGPIFMGTPKDKNLTIWTTVYPTDYEEESQRGINLRSRMNNTDYIFICHEPGTPEMEATNNIYWLTPLHRKFIVPWYFPPSVTAQRHISKPLKFATQGAIRPRHRNVESLQQILEHRSENKGERDFRIRIMDRVSLDESVKPFPQKLRKNVTSRHPKVQEIQDATYFHYMNHMIDTSAMLVLIDETNYDKAAKRGYKLTSSISWAVGFGMNLVIYEELAAVFGISRDNETACIYNHSKYILEAFDECIEKGVKSLQSQNQNYLALHSKVVKGVGG
ncbi:MAG: hypothetical protein SGILL_000329 [Bacillariaceae sp.]